MKKIKKILATAITLPLAISVVPINVKAWNYQEVCQAYDQAPEKIKLIIDGTDSITALLKSLTSTPYRLFDYLGGIKFQSEELLNQTVSGNSCNFCTRLIYIYHLFENLKNYLFSDHKGDSNCLDRQLFVDKHSFPDEYLFKLGLPKVKSFKNQEDFSQFSTRVPEKDSNYDIKLTIDSTEAWCKLCNDKILNAINDSAKLIFDKLMHLKPSERQELVELLSKNDSNMEQVQIFEDPIEQAKDIVLNSLDQILPSIGDENIAQNLQVNMQQIQNQTHEPHYIQLTNYVTVFHYLEAIEQLFVGNNDYTKYLNPWSTGHDTVTFDIIEQLELSHVMSGSYSDHLRMYSEEEQIQTTYPEEIQKIANKIQKKYQIISQILSNQPWPSQRAEPTQINPKSVKPLVVQSDFLDPEDIKKAAQNIEEISNQIFFYTKTPNLSDKTLNQANTLKKMLETLTKALSNFDGKNDDQNMSLLSIFKHVNDQFEKSSSLSCKCLYQFGKQCTPKAPIIIEEFKKLDQNSDSIEPGVLKAALCATICYYSNLKVSQISLDEIKKSKYIMVEHLIQHLDTSRKTILSKINELNSKSAFFNRDIKDKKESLNKLQEAITYVIFVLQNSCVPKMDSNVPSECITASRSLSDCLAKIQNLYETATEKRLKYFFEVFPVNSQIFKKSNTPVKTLYTLTEALDECEARVFLKS